MSAADELDEVPDAASPDASASKLRRDARQLFREKHGRDLDTLHKSSLDTEEELHKCVLHTLRAALQKREGRDPTLAEYQAACESEGIPAAVLQSHLDDRMNVEGGNLAQAAFFKEHGRKPTDEEFQHFNKAAEGDDPMDHAGPVEAEEAEMYRGYARLSFMIQEARDPTDDALSTFTDKMVRWYRRAVLKAVNPDVAAVRRILVSRNVAAAKRDDAAAPEARWVATPAVAFGPPPRPEDAEETFFERAARLEHDKVLVVAAAAYQTMCTLDDAAAERHDQNLRVLAKSDETWDKQTEVARGVISGLGDKAPCRFSAAFAVNAVIGTGNSTAWPGDATDIYATSYATLLERTARALFDQGSNRYYIPGDRFDLPSLSSDDAADIVPSVENTTWDDEGGCFSVARRVHRLHVLERIRDAVLEKKERDAAVAREAARVRRKQQEASSRAAEADLLDLLDAEDAAGHLEHRIAPRKKKKKKKKKQRGESPVSTPAAAPETKAAAPEAPAAPADAAAEAKPPETDASEAAPEEAPVSEPDADAPLSATGERRRSLADLAAAEAVPAPPPTDAPPEEDAWETVARRPRQIAAATPPRRRRSDHADAPKHAVDALLALEATAGALTDHALRKLGAFGGRCYVTQKGDIYQPITEPRPRHYERSLAETKAPEPESDASAGPASLLPLLAPKDEAPPPPPPPAPGLDPDVARFLDNLGLSGVGPILAREEIDWETLGLLDAEGLADAGIPRDDAQFIIVAYGSLGGVPPPPTPASAPRPAPPAAPPAAAVAAPPPTAPARDSDECPICLEPKESPTAIVPCGHILCGGCAAKYTTSCPVCREPVASRMRVFW